MTATRDARTGLGPGVGERLAALLRSAGVPEARIGVVPLPGEGWAFPEVRR